MSDKKFPNTTYLYQIHRRTGASLSYLIRKAVQRFLHEEETEHHEA